MKSPGCTRNFRCCHVACCRYLWYVHWCTITNLTCATCAHIRDLCCAVAAGMFAWLRLSPEVACCTQKQLCTCPGACSARGPKRNGSSAPCDRCVAKLPARGRSPARAAVASAPRDGSAAAVASAPHDGSAAPSLFDKIFPRKRSEPRDHQAARSFAPHGRSTLLVWELRRDHV